MSLEFPIPPLPTTTTEVGLFIHETECLGTGKSCVVLPLPFQPIDPRATVKTYRSQEMRGGSGRMFVTVGDIHTGNPMLLPYQRGDVVPVQEPWRTSREFDDQNPAQLPRELPIHYLADGDRVSSYDDVGFGYETAGVERRAEHMRRQDCRLLLTVLATAVIRLQSITHTEILACGFRSPEGAEPDHQQVMLRKFADNWDRRWHESHSGLQRVSWSCNPMVLLVQVDPDWAEGYTR